MIDPIKQFVEQNRAAFEDKEPPADAFQQIRNRLKATAAAAEKEEKKKVVPLFSKTKWMVAASVLLAVTVTYILFNRETPANTSQLANKPAQEITKPQADIPGVAKPEITKNKTAIAANTVKQNIQEQILVKTVTSKRNGKITKAAQNPVIKLPADLYAGLADSTSASVRLAAILDMGRASKMNQDMLGNLSKMLNNDSNSNVRLAALNVMSQYANDEYVSSLLVQSLTTQNDPLVQLGLIDVLKKLDNVKIEDRLFALADDPDTFSAVKDEAYTVLLNQNKL